MLLPSGLSDKTFAVSLSRGIINKLEDDELEAVIAHELTHIINRDVRLLIVSIIFVGIFAFITEMAFRSLRFAGRGRGKKEGGALAIVLISCGTRNYRNDFVFFFPICLVEKERIFSRRWSC